MRLQSLVGAIGLETCLGGPDDVGQKNVRASSESRRRSVITALDRIHAGDEGYRPPAAESRCLTANVRPSAGRSSHALEDGPQWLVFEPVLQQAQSPA